MLRALAVVIEADLKTLLRTGELPLMLLMLGSFQFLFFAIGSVLRKEEQLFFQLTGYGDSVLYQIAGMPILFLSIGMSWAIGQFVIELGRGGKLEQLQTTATDFRVVIAGRFIVMAIMSLLYYLAITVPFIQIRAGPEVLSHFLPALLVLMLGFVPIFLFAVVVSVVMLLARTEALIDLVSSIVYTFTGVAYPITVFPAVVQTLASLLPQTILAETVRNIVLLGVLEPARLIPFIAVALGYGVFSYLLYSKLEYSVRRGGRYEVVTE
ncbi:MAG: hypothetical protein NZ957_02015 [Thaumarchaeota archaeon]|nr:hypothetical protein [Candidatus Calditenuaceae archaeon]MDW8041944.1 hypothetical protein [Nitrososphaerota archaeon]